MVTTEQAYYSRGFQKPVSDTHAWRTVENSAKYVVPVLQPDFHVLDVGSGPGTITIDFAKTYLPQGSIIGVEPTQELIDLANENKAKDPTGVLNVSFQLGSIYSLPFDDNTFDLVHAHQVVIHLQDPVKALRELERVTKPGGYVCVRDADLESSVAYPEKFEFLCRFYVSKGKSAVSTDTKAGRKLRARALEAGYVPENLKTTFSSWLMADDSLIKKLWAKGTVTRIKSGSEVVFADDPVKNKEINDEAARLWEEWLQDDSSVFTMVHYEIVYQKPI
ncbi:putative methyltransferase C1B3.06c [Candida viswanathii]|uniref:Putative methyltransferase C1B3.06c n=1 Tax=Candida viswanathii TaxID=5486 RepID=A0A367Y1A2_9ASCO|nr:putative methyltransferase C1B3.06c [Candida viswanathii]